jgi:hypothetical protein
MTKQQSCKMGKPGKEFPGTGDNHNKAGSLSETVRGNRCGCGEEDSLGTSNPGHTRVGGLLPFIHSVDSGVCGGNAERRL